MFPIGTRTVTCVARDACGNESTCKFDVTVTNDLMPPVIRCPANVVVTTCDAGGAVVSYSTPGATDSVDLNPQVTCVPPSGSLFPFGTTVVSCEAVDACTNRSLCTFTVTVMRADTNPPSLTCPNNVVAWTCETNGLVVNYPVPTVMDDMYRSPTVECSPPSGSVFPLGVTAVTITATDDCSNRSTCSFTVTVVADIAPPAIQCPTNLNVFTANAVGRLVYFESLAVTDDPEASISCAPASGSLFPVGVTPVVCTARDACGHERSCTFTVEVTLLT